MRSLLFYVFCLGVLYAWVQACNHHGRAAGPELDRIPVPAFAHPVPGDEHNLRSAQPTLNDLDTLLQTGLLTTVIRLNGNGKDAGGVPVSEEQTLCEAYKVTFYRIDAHLPGSARLIHRLLSQGRTLIHCRHGFDRTGAMVGYHLRQIGYTRDEVIRHNGWKDYLKIKGPEYEKYLSAIQ